MNTERGVATISSTYRLCFRQCRADKDFGIDDIARHQFRIVNDLVEIIGKLEFIMPCRTPVRASYTERRKYAAQYMGVRMEHYSGHWIFVTPACCNSEGVMAILAPEKGQFPVSFSSVDTILVF